MIGGNNVQTELKALAERARRSYGAAIENWCETAFTLKEARAIAAHGDWTPFLNHAGIPIRTAQNMLKIANAGLKYETVSCLGGIRETLEALAASPKGVRLLVARHARIAQLTTSLSTARSSLMDLQERDALMAEAPENAQHLDRLTELQADRRKLRFEVNSEKVKRAEAEVKVKGIRKQVAKAEAERDRLKTAVREAEDT